MPTNRPDCLPHWLLGCERPATLGWHTHYGPAHLDLLLAAGPRCWTIGLEPRDGDLRLSQWRWHTKPLHRRHYLDYSGPVSGGRGFFQHWWSGSLRILAGPNGWQVRAGHLLMFVLRRDGLAVPQSLASMSPCHRNALVT